MHLSELVILCKLRCKLVVQLKMGPPRTCDPRLAGFAVAREEGVWVVVAGHARGEGVVGDGVEQAVVIFQVWLQHLASNRERQQKNSS